MAHFRANTCESCKHYDGEHYMDGPAICSLHKLLIWPGNRGCHDTSFCPSSAVAIRERNPPTNDSLFENCYLCNDWRGIAQKRPF